MGQLDGFHFDPDLVQVAINEYRALRDKIRHDLPKVRGLLEARAPGFAPETLNFHRVMQASHQEHLRELLALQTKIQNDLTNLKAAMARYRATEETNTRGLSQQDPPA